MQFNELLFQDWNKIINLSLKKKLKAEDLKRKVKRISLSVIDVDLFEINVELEDE